MIVEITSLAPTVALRTPAIAAHAPPASAPASTASRMCGSFGMPANDEPTQTAA
jgi:hypothetical protein